MDYKKIYEGLGHGFGQGLFDKDSVLTSKPVSEVYDFIIEWNTGDPWWDNPPDEEDFRGTIEELEDYLEGKPENFRDVLKGDTIYDDDGETWNVTLKKYHKDL